MQALFHPPLQKKRYLGPIRIVNLSYLKRYCDQARPFLLGKSTSYVIDHNANPSREWWRCLQYSWFVHSEPKLSWSPESHCRTNCASGGRNSLCLCFLACSLVRLPPCVPCHLRRRKPKHRIHHSVPYMFITPFLGYSKFSLLLLSIY